MKDETKYISLELCPKIQLLPTEVSYFKIYEEKYHLTIADVMQTLSAEIMAPDDSENRFETAETIPVFVLDSAVITQTNQTVELERSFYRGDKYRFAIHANPKF
jgi:Transcriptional regulators